MAKITIPIIGSTMTYECTCEDGIYSCNCPHWVYRLSRQNNNQLCKHLQQAINNGSFNTISIKEPIRIPRQFLVPLVNKVIKPIEELFDDFSLCGSWRREKETIKDIDIIVCVDKDKTQLPKMHLFSILHNRLTSIGLVKVKGSGEIIRRYHGKVGFYDGSEWVNDPNYPDPIQIEITVIPWESWGSALCHFTGSMQENTRLREIARKRGYSLSQYGFRELINGEAIGRLIRIDNEQNVYSFLSELYVEPKNR